MAGCDWSIGSECATKAKIDITHYIQNFTTWHQVGYNHPTYGGCSWFTNKIAYINNLAPTNNPAMLARRESKIAYWRCMEIGCGCPSPVQYGCMDDGQRGNDYINNRGTWNFLTLNNTTSSGVVTRVDGEGLIGKQTGSAYPGVAATNYFPGLDFDNGNCFYASEIPYMLSGCRDNTPHNPLLAVNGYPDINGHGTAAVYNCAQSQTVPIIPDPCGAGPSTPCVANNNSGYHSQNFDPCANFDCQYGNTLPNYASDMNTKYTRWEDGPNLGISDVFRPFGDTDCCNYPEPQQSNPDITYDFRYGHPTQAGGITMFSSMSSFWGAGVGERHKIGGPYFMYSFNRWDVVGNTQFVGYGQGGVIDYSINVVYGTTSSSSLQQQVHNTLCPDIYNPQPGQASCNQGAMPTSPCPDTEIVRFRVYDVHKTLIWDGDYKYTCHQLQVCHAAPSINEICWMKSLMLHLVTERYSITPGQMIDLCAIGNVTNTSPPPSCIDYQNQSGNPFGISGSGYIRLDSAISGTTVDLGNIWQATPGFPQTSVAPRIPSTHWVTPRGNTANLTNMWTGQNLNWDPVTNPFTVGTHIPHSCNDCGGGPNSSGYSIKNHWLEPGPSTLTPSNYFYNNPNLLPNPSSVHVNYPTALINCTRVPMTGGGSEDDISSSFIETCEDALVVNTKITYSKDENQEVTRISSSTDVLTPEPTQIISPTTPPPTTPSPTIPPPTTPPPTTPPPTSPPTTMTGGGGY